MTVSVTTLVANLRLLVKHHPLVTSGNEEFLHSAEPAFSGYR